MVGAIDHDGMVWCCELSEPDSEMVVVLVGGVVLALLREVVVEVV